MSSVEDLRKALNQRAKRLGNIMLSFENENQVLFLSGYVAHKNDKLLLIEDVLDVLEDYVLVFRKQLSEMVDKVKLQVETHINLEKSTPISVWTVVFDLIKKELLEAQK